MPRPKKTATTPVSKAKPKEAKQPAKKPAAPRKTASKTKTKAKPVIIDVIEDDDDINDSNFFSDESLAKSQLIPSISENIRANAEDSPVLEEGELDVQKKFFSELVSEMKTSPATGALKEAALKNNRVRQKKINLYRRLVWKFLALVGVLAVIVFYFSFSKLTILVTPQVEAISDTLFLRVGGATATSTDDAREKINGSVNELAVEVVKKYPATGEDALGEEVTGTVTLVNNYVKDQPLVATTRLLSGDNKLFRLKSAVVIPAGGKIEAAVYADKVSSEMAIGPSHFTIPGLWAGLQDKIYADSFEAFSYKTTSEKYVKAADLSAALKDVNSLVLAKAKEGQNFPDSDLVLYQILDSADAQTDAQAGDKAEEFTLTIKAKVVAVIFQKQEAEKLAAAKLNLLVPDDKELSAFKPESLSYTFESYDSNTKTAAIKASFSGLMILKNNADIIDREKLVNLNASQIATYLGDYPEIGHYELKFFPTFIKKAPNLVDRIEVKIAK